MDRQMDDGRMDDRRMNSWADGWMMDGRMDDGRVDGQYIEEYTHQVVFGGLLLMGVPWPSPSVWRVCGKNASFPYVPV